jgi:hypothetical protein
MGLPRFKHLLYQKCICINDPGQEICIDYMTVINF